VCSLHFNKTDYHPSGRRLKTGSCPNVLPPGVVPLPKDIVAQFPPGKWSLTAFPSLSKDIH